MDYMEGSQEAGAREKIEEEDQEKPRTLHCKAVRSGYAVIMSVPAIKRETNAPPD
jgi:hypothetical protein